jgi:hypothetical protein
MKKQAGTATNKASISNVLNTFLNPFASTLMGDYWVPESLMAKKKKYRENPVGPFTGNAPFDKVLFHGAAVGTSALALTALARYISGSYNNQKQDADRVKERTEVVGARNPIFSPDPYLDDLAEEQAQQSIGVRKSGMDKEAAISSWLKAIIPLSLMIGGSVAGYKTVDNYLDRKKGRELEGDIDELSNEYDRLNYIKLMKARGASLADIPAPNHIPQEDTLEGPMPKVAEETEVRDKEVTQEESGWDAVKSLSALVLLSTAVSSGILTKRYFDAEDPRRIEMNEMEHGLKSLSNTQQNKSPVEIAPVPPALKYNLDQHLNQTGKKKPTAIESHALPARTIEATPVDLPSSGISRDLSDPTMAIL